MQLTKRQRSWLVIECSVTVIQCHRNPASCCTQSDPIRQGGTVTASITLTKQAVARRLMSTAVAIALADGDPLAIHLVGASALKIMRDLLKTRGPSYVDLHLIEGLYDVALRRARGEPPPFHLDPTSDQLIEAIATEIKSGQIKSAADMKIVGQTNEHKYFKFITDPYNFLKHADNDPLETLDEADLRPIETILHCIAAYRSLFPNEQLERHVVDFAEVHKGEFQLK